MGVLEWLDNVVLAFCRVGVSRGILGVIEVAGNEMEQVIEME